MGNIGSWIVAIILIGIIGWIIYRLVKDKRQGKSSCGSNCGCCPNASLCHSNIKKEK